LVRGGGSVNLANMLTPVQLEKPTESTLYNKSLKPTALRMARDSLLATTLTSQHNENQSLRHTTAA